MVNEMHTGALVMALEPLDSLYKIGAISVAQRIITTLRFSGVHPIVVLISKDSNKRLEKNLAHLGAIFYYVDSLDTIDSIQQGIRYLEDSCEQILIAPVDVALFSVDTVTALMQSGQALAVPAYQGVRGYPLLIGREYFSDFVTNISHNHIENIFCKEGVMIEVDDPGVITHIDQKEKCDQIAQQHSLNQWRPFFHLKIMREEVFWGPGVRQLLFLIGKTKSVRLACQQMGISYSKGWKLLNRFEEELNVQVVLRKKGGIGGGETDLTEKGKVLMKQFDAFEKECIQAVNTIFVRHFHEDKKNVSD